MEDGALYFSFSPASLGKRKKQSERRRWGLYQRCGCDGLVMMEVRVDVTLGLHPKKKAKNQ